MQAREDSFVADLRDLAQFDPGRVFGEGLFDLGGFANDDENQVLRREVLLNDALTILQRDSIESAEVVIDLVFIEAKKVELC